ncbi:MAG TPA: dihydropyrimidinase [Anaerolineales bacterium]|jgi:dihydropyrimidinase|nr:dihydropyrimidinase [Anaerolineales bacterium]
MLLIKSGTLVTHEGSFRADLLVEGEKISEVGADLTTPQAEVVNASGKLVMPGGVDPHTHFDLEMFNTVSSDDHYTGHKAAAFGGTTTVMDFVPQPAKGALRSGIDAWHAKADSRAAVDWGFHMNITRLDERVAKEIPSLLALGISTLKVFMAYNGRLRLLDGEIFRVMQLARDHGMLTMLHAENGDVIDILVSEALAAGHTSPEWHARTRPAWGGVEAVLRACALAAQANARLYIVHMNSAGEMDQLNYARQRGVQVMGETCPQYLFFSEDDLRRPEGAKWVCSPPMRAKEDNNALWAGLTKDQIQTVGTDHCPFFFDGSQSIKYEGKSMSIPGKELGEDDFTKIPNGLPMVGDRLPILWTYGVGSGKLTPKQFVALTSTNPAKIFGLYPRKGALQPGSDADIVIWDPERELTYGRTHSHHRTDYNLFEGWKLKGFPEKVFLRGTLIVNGDEWLGRAGLGQYLVRGEGQFI